MTDTSLTTIKIKKINRNKVYHFIYHEKSTFKLNIAQNLSMGLSTVNQNLKLLEEDGLIRKNGFFESTGGRKADAIEIVPTAKIGLGAAILKDMIDIVATDLYGNTLHTRTCSLSYEHSHEYYQSFAKYIHDFIDDFSLEVQEILGLTIATQGIISNDSHSVDYGAILENNSMTLDDFQPYFHIPCRLEHDSKSAANLELWTHKDISSAIVLLLNRNMGGAIITNGKVQSGTHMHSGLIEHLCINSDGATCYCGKRGCLETYCSANALIQISKMDIPDFFVALHQGNSECITIWDEYLNYLALAIRNLNIIIDGKIIICGYLASYFRNEDLDNLLKRINNYSPFPLTHDDIVVGTSGQFAQAIGASLYYIKQFLLQI